VRNVSIPYRYDKNKLVSGVKPTPSVSIPYRYDKNLPRVVLPVPEAPRFQFLIGTIKTLNNLIWFSPIAAQFQFLIGTIKTLKFGAKMDTVISVSIPYRYDKNNYANGKLGDA